MRIKRFSGYSEASPGGVSYHPGQVVTKLVLDPVEYGVSKLEKVPIEPLKRKGSRIKKVISPLKKVLHISEEGRN